MLLGAAQIGDKPDDAVVAVGRASSGRARIPVAERVVNMQTSTRSMASQTRSSESCFAMRGKARRRFIEPLFPKNFACCAADYARESEANRPASRRGRLLRGIRPRDSE